MARARTSTSSPMSSPPGAKSPLSATAVVSAQGEITPGKVARTALAKFEPESKASTANLRTKQKRRQTSPSALSGPALRPGLQLSGCHLQTPTGQDAAIVRGLTLLPESLAIIKPNWPFCFNINCTPQLGPPISESLAEDLYRQYVCSSPLLRPGKLPYLHLGSTNLGFQLDFYLILPNAGGTPHAVNTGHLSDEALQILFDRCMVPALEAADPRRTGFKSWMQAMNESNLNILKSRKRDAGPETQEERIHCVLLHNIWSSINACTDEEVRNLLDGKILVAIGTVERHSWHDDWIYTYAAFKRDWESAIETKYLKPESRIKVEMILELDLPGIDARTEVEKARGFPERKRVRR